MPIDWKRFAVGLGVNYLVKRIDDDQFWSDLLRKYLKPQLDEIEPLLLVQSFQDNYDFKLLLQEQHIDKFKEFVKGNEDLMVKLKDKSRLKMIAFEWSWIEEWFKKDHKNLLAIINNHPQKKEFQIYITNGILDLAKKFVNSF